MAETKLAKFRETNFFHSSKTSKITLFIKVKAKIIIKIVHVLCKGSEVQLYLTVEEVSTVTVLRQCRFDTFVETTPLRAMCN